MRLGIDPTVDFVAKCVLGSPQHPAITLHFLNSVLECDPPITQVEILNPLNEKDRAEGKVSIVDIRARDASGGLYNIEIQTTRAQGLGARLTYYAATQFVGQMREGDDYIHLCPSICICLLRPPLFPAESPWHHRFALRSEVGLLLTDRLAIHLLELEKFGPPPENEVVRNPLEQWLCFFREAANANANALRSRLADPVFDEVIGVLEMIQRTPTERDYYEQRLKMEMDQRAYLAEARFEGKQVGLEEGKQVGLEEGLSRGALIGKIELVQQALGFEERSAEELRRLDMAELTDLAARLLEQFERRG